MVEPNSYSTLEGSNDTENWDGSTTLGTRCQEGESPDTQKFPRFDILGGAQTNIEPENSNLGKEGNKCCFKNKSKGIVFMVAN